jgi:hypothetical protein
MKNHIYEKTYFHASLSENEIDMFLFGIVQMTTMVYGI